MSEDSSDSRSAFSANQRSGALAQLDPRLVHAHDRVGDRLGVGARDDDAVDALLDQLGRRVVLARDHDAGGSPRGGLDDDHAVALAAGGEQHAQRAAHLASTPLGVDESGREDGLPQRRARRSTRRAPVALGAVAEELAPQPRESARRRAATPPRRAARCFSGISRPANTTTGSARCGVTALQRSGVLPRAAPSPRRAAPPRAGARHAAREKQNARWGTRAHSSCTSVAHRARPRRRGSRASRSGSTPRASRRPARSARAAARGAAASSEKYGNDARVHDVVAAAVAQQVHEHPEPEHERRQDAPAPAGRVQRHARARGHDPHALVEVQLARRAPTGAASGR